MIYTDELIRMGFKERHAGRLAAALHLAGEKSLDGLRFELSGSLTSVFRHDEAGRKLICQVDAKQ